MGGGAAAVPWASVAEKWVHNGCYTMDEAKLVGSSLKKGGSSLKQVRSPEPECSGAQPSQTENPSSKAEERDQPGRLKPGDVAAFRASIQVLISVCNEDMGSGTDFIAKAPRLCREAQHVQEQARRDLHKGRGSQVYATSCYQSYVVLIAKTEHVSRQLQEARYARATDASICNARIAQLAQLPAPDAGEHGSMEAVEQQLESEKNALEQARNLLLSREEQLRQFLDVLGNAQSSLTKEAPARRSAVRHGLRGLRCDNLLDGESPFPDKPKTSAASAPCSTRGSLAASVFSNRSSCHAGQQKEHENDEDDAMELALHRSQEHQARTFELCAQAAETIKSTTNSCASHASRTSAALKSCASERAYLRATLEDDLRRVDQATRSERWLLRRTPKWAEHQTRLNKSQQLLTDLSSTQVALQQHLWHTREEQRLAEECLRLTSVTAGTAGTGLRRTQSAGRVLRRTQSAGSLGSTAKGRSPSRIHRPHCR